MSTKNVIVEMSEDTAAWLQLNPALGVIRIIGEFVPAAGSTNKLEAAKKGNGKKQEFPRGTKIKAQHRPPADAPTRRAAWDYLKDKFGDMTISAKDARQSLHAKGMVGGSSLVTKMLRMREMKPVNEKG